MIGHKYKTSEHKEIYEQIAEEVGVTPEHVYDLAHGKVVHSHDDNVVLTMLAEHNVISIRDRKHSSHGHGRSKGRRRRKVQKTINVVFFLLLLFAALAVIYYLKFMTEPVVGR